MQETTKRERFKRLSTHRTNAVLKKLRVLGNCANRQAYEFTEEEIDKIFAMINEQVKATRVKFVFSKEREFQL